MTAPAPSGHGAQVMWRKELAAAGPSRQGGNPAQFRMLAAVFRQPGLGAAAAPGSHAQALQADLALGCSQRRHEVGSPGLHLDTIQANGRIRGLQPAGIGMGDA